MFNKAYCPKNWQVKAMPVEHHGVKHATETKKILL
jgi:hypothetical protein